MLANALLTSWIYITLTYVWNEYSSILDINIWMAILLHLFSNGRKRGDATLPLSPTGTYACCQRESCRYWERWKSQKTNTINDEQKTNELESERLETKWKPLWGKQEIEIWGYGGVGGNKLLNTLKLIFGRKVIIREE